MWYNHQLWGGIIYTVEMEYARGWNDCLEMIQNILNDARNIKDAKMKVDELLSLVREKKFEKIRCELGLIKTS